MIQKQFDTSARRVGSLGGRAALLLAAQKTSTETAKNSNAASCGKL
jgi:hypothetical protein